MTPPGVRFTLTPRPAEALRALARRDERPSEVCAAEVLTRQVHPAHMPEVARRAAAESETPAAAVEC